jgi:tetratricopeptide (TPR) repeat protein
MYLFVENRKKFNGVLIMKNKLIFFTVSLFLIFNFYSRAMDNDDYLKSDDPKTYYLKSVKLEEDGNINDSIKFLKKAAKKNHSKASYELALRYRDGDEVKKSQSKFVKYLEISNKSGNEKAKKILLELDEEKENSNSPRFFYLESIKLREKKHIEESLEYLKKAAKMEHPHAAYELALKYKLGDGVEESCQKYIEYLVIAQKAKHEMATTILHKLACSLDEETKHLPEPKWMKRLRTTCRYAENVSNMTWALQKVGECAITFLNILQYRQQSQMLEKALICGQLIGGTSNLTYGITASIITQKKEHLIWSGIGLTQLGSIYLQHISVKKYEKLKKEHEDIIINTKQEKKEYIEDFCKENIEKLKKEEKMYNNQTLCIICAEEIFKHGIQEWNINPKANFLYILGKSAAKVMLNNVPTFIMHYTKDESNAERIRNHIYSLMDGVRNKIGLEASSYLQKVFCHLTDHINSSDLIPDDRVNNSN